MVGYAAPRFIQATVQLPLWLYKRSWLYETWSWNEVCLWVCRKSWSKSWVHGTWTLQCDLVASSSRNSLQCARILNKEMAKAIFAVEFWKVLQLAKDRHGRSCCLLRKVLGWSTHELVHLVMWRFLPQDEEDSRWWTWWRSLQNDWSS